MAGLVSHKSTKNNIPKLLIVCGPTATGKSELALHLGRSFGGEMISADSMQIYQGLVVGTAALLPQDAQGVPLHMTGFLPPNCTYSVAEYVAAAQQCIAQIAARGALPVLCGGTGLYISSLVNGISFTSAPVPATLRAELLEKWNTLGAQPMLDTLAQQDPDRAAKLHPQDKNRILRALENYAVTGKTSAQREAESLPEHPPYDALFIGLDSHSRDDLYQRINTRVDKMMQQGLLDEAKMVHQNRHTYLTAAQAIGYKELFPYIDGVAPLEECIASLKQATRRYAKRQITWFRSIPNINWLEAGAADSPAKAEALVRNFV